MHILKLSLLTAAMFLGSCSEFASKSNWAQEKQVDPASELGFKNNQLSEMVAKAKSVGGKAVDFLATDLFIKANDASMRGDNQTAVQIFKYVVELVPQDAYLRKKLAIEMIRTGEVKEAEKVLESVYLQSKYTDDSVGLILAGVYAALEKPSMARQTYQKIIDTSQDIEEACLFLAKSFAVEKKYNEAHSLLTKCEKKDKNDPVFSFYKGKIEIDRDRKVEAKKFFEKSLKMDPSYSQAALALGAYYEEKEDLDSAIKIYKNFLKSDGNETNSPVLSRLVTVLFSLEKNEEVIPYAETLSSIDSTDLNLKVRLGLLYSDTGKYEEATNLFKDVLTVVPESDKVIYYLGALHQQTNKIDVAIDYFKKIPSTSPLFTDASIQIGQMLSGFAREEFVQLHKEGLAFNQFNKYMNDRLENHEELSIEFKMLQATYFEDTFQYKKAIETLTNVKNHKLFTDSHNYYLASIYEKDSQYLEARRIVQLIVDKDPNNAHALNFLGYSYLDKNERMDLAYEYISKAAKLKPDDGYIRDSLAWYYYQVGKYSEALSESKKAMELVNSDVTITKHLGMIYQKLQNFEKAKELLTQALQNAKAQNEREDVLNQLKDMEKIRLPASESK